MKINIELVNGKIVGIFSRTWESLQTNRKMNWILKWHLLHIFFIRLAYICKPLKAWF